MKAHFFGSPDSQLLGVHHAPRKPAEPRQAVLICSPLWQEYSRTHWALRSLANQLARKGNHVLRFDYRGQGDSYGNIRDVQSLDAWEQDIRAAIEQLLELSGAESVLLVGLRFGANLAAEVARKHPRVNSLVAWEPIATGERYLTGLRTMHAKMLDLWVCKQTTVNDDHYEEILGMKSRRSLISEIDSHVLSLEDLAVPQLIVDCESVSAGYSHPVPSLQKVVDVEDAFSWGDLNALETAWLRGQTTRTIVKFVNEMFERLQRFEGLVPREDLVNA